MRGIRMKALGCLLILLLVMIPISVSAQDHLEYSPNEWNFGKVEIGSSEIGIFTLTNVDGASVLVSLIGWTNENTSCVSHEFCDPFVLTNGAVPPNPPITIEVGGSYDVPVEFSPSSPGTYFAILHIRTNAANAPDLYFSIFGEGVPEVEPPSELMAELIASFNEYVESGTVEGSGPGRSASGRLKAFGNMLKASSDLINAGEYESACVQLQDALDRIDGVVPPPDFVTGPDAETLKIMIEEVRNELGCL